jgi:NAD(P)-dependent dehydrogenase (short-subunit alcohol dehydrogenase family)
VGTRVAGRRIALVRGAARGIGRAIALDFAAQGADFLVNYRLRPDVAEEVTKARWESFSVFTVLMKKAKDLFPGFFPQGLPTGF